VEHYSGPQDITQFYFYMGILLVPLALVGLTSTRERWYGLVLTVAGVWYAMGPAGGLYSLVSVMPGFHNVRAPVNIWFVAALGLALLAAAGVGVLRARFRSPWIMLALLGITGLDLYYWNMERNGLAYARASFQELYGNADDRFRAVAAPLTPIRSTAFGRPTLRQLSDRSIVHWTTGWKSRSGTTPWSWSATSNTSRRRRRIRSY
jgi:hypothetical protein